jgi:acetolactate synthase-1/2/3 large subunit
MGFTLPAAIGAKLACPGKQVIGIVGDGDFMMTMQELSVAVQYNIPVVMIVANNSGWISIRDLQMNAFGIDRAIATDFVKEKGGVYTPDFCRIADAFGCHAQKIKRGAEVRPAMEKALKAGKPAVIEAIVNREFPYTGSPAVGWWDVPIPTYLKERRKKYESARKEEQLN